MTNNLSKNSGSLVDKISVVIATAGGAGFAPKAPGTCGSIVAMPLIWAMAYDQLSGIQLVAVMAITTIVGFWATAHVEKIWHTHDDQRIVIDEVAGMFVTLLWFDFTWPRLIVGFLLFRLFDVTKPGPIGVIDRKWPGAWGTFFDDIVAGFFAAGVLAIATTFWSF